MSLCDAKNELIIDISDRRGGREVVVRINTAV